MSARRTKVELKPPHATSADLVWIAIRRLRRFTVAEVRKASNASRAPLQRLLKRLLAAGIVGRCEGGYMLVKDTGVETPRVTPDGRRVTRGENRERAWAAMKPIGSFTYRELAEIAEASRTAVKHYVEQLAQSGYLLVVDRGRPGRLRRYRLDPLRNTGPKAPVFREKGRSVFDPNTGVSHPVKARRRS